jgi:hypothetical protein
MKRHECHISFFFIDQEIKTHALFCPYQKIFDMYIYISIEFFFSIFDVVDTEGLSVREKKSSMTQLLFFLSFGMINKKIITQYSKGICRRIRRIK